MFRIIGEMVDKAHTFSTEAEAVAAADALAKAFPGRYYWVEELRWTEGYCAHVAVEGQDVAAELEQAIAAPAAVQEERGPNVIALVTVVQDAPEEAGTHCRYCGAGRDQDKCDAFDWPHDQKKGLSRWVPAPALPALYEAVMSLDLQTIREVGKIRSLRRKEIAQHIRKLFSALNIRGVSVTAPNYSMAQAVHISVPDFPAGTWACKRALEVQLEKLILRAFPDLGDRSDTMSDHFDYKLSFS